MTTFTEMMRDDVASWTTKCLAPKAQRDHTFVPSRKRVVAGRVRVEGGSGAGLCFQKGVGFIGGVGNVWTQSEEEDVQFLHLQKPHVTHRCNTMIQSWREKGEASQRGE